MLVHTPIVRGLVEDGELVGFARVVGDLVYHATLLDVIVRRDRRGAGLGDALVASIIDDARLAGLRGPLLLTCRDDKIAFYSRWGFDTVSRLPSIEGQGSGVAMRRRAGCEVRPQTLVAVGPGRPRSPLGDDLDEAATPFRAPPASATDP